MYDRYTITSSSASLEKDFQVKMPEQYQANFNATPTQQMPVITSDDPETGKMCYWGLPQAQSKNKAISVKLYNLPAFSAFQRPVYRKLIENRRCVILADGFYIWKQLSKKQKTPYYCYFNNRIPFGIAGVWEVYEDLDGNTSSIFNMLTVSATHDLRNYQEDMPAVIKAEAIRQWLRQDLSIAEAEDLVKNITGSGLLLHSVSPRITNTSLNSEQLIKPSAPSDQFGNYTLFS